jgi:hypothetical protein
MTSDSLLERAYRCAYWRHNEFQLIAADFPNLPGIRYELKKLDRIMAKLADRLGYMPEA